MKKNFMIAAAMLFAATVSVGVNAQQPARQAAAQQPARQAAAPAAGAAATNVAVPDGKIAIVYAAAFQDGKAGIARLAAAANRVDSEFQPRRTELQGMQTRYNTLIQNIEKQRAVADPATLQKQVEEADRLKTEMERKQQDGQRDYQRRFGEVMAPLFDDIGKALDAFAKQRGINVIIDASKLEGAIFVTNNAVDITNAFIAEYNQRNPATASAATPGR